MYKMEAILKENNLYEPDRDSALWRAGLLRSLSYPGDGQQQLSKMLLKEVHRIIENSEQAYR